MSELMPPIRVQDKRVSLHFALPRAFLQALTQVARDTQTPRSDLLQEFLAFGWKEFAQHRLTEGMQFLQRQSQFIGGQTGLAADIPDWLRAFQSKNQAGEPSIVFVAFVDRSWWKAIAQAMREVEKEFLECSLSDLMKLYFAFAWSDFERLKIEEEVGMVCAA